MVYNLFIYSDLVHVTLVTKELIKHVEYTKINVYEQ